MRLPGKRNLLFSLIPISIFVYLFISSAPSQPKRFAKQSLHSTTIITAVPVTEHHQSKEIIRSRPSSYHAVSDRSAKSRINSYPGQGGEVGEVERRISRCLEATHLRSLTPDFESDAQANARYFLKEFRKVIPLESNSNYSSHCWETNFEAAWTPLEANVKGYINGHSFGRLTDRKFEKGSPPIRILSWLSKVIPTYRFKTKLVCLPNVFLAGFPKCGSTFIWCFITKLLRTYLRTLGHPEVEKEPHFWVRADANHEYFKPVASDLGGYLMNFVPGMNKMLKYPTIRNDPLMIDGTPNLIFNWPRYDSKDHNLTNYCIMPAVLPQLLPNSKFVVVMRNPVNMLYSAFWFSCQIKVKKLDETTQLEGPRLFHERVASKISIFNSCMKDKDTTSISHECSFDNNGGESYGKCIEQRMHLLDMCVKEINFNLFSPELSICGRSRIEMSLYYAHVRKWLSVVPKDKLLFLTLEEVAEDLSKVAKDVLQFLEIQFDELRIDRNVRVIRSSCQENASSYKKDPRLKMRPDTMHLLKQFFRPFNAKLAELVGDDKFLAWNND